MLDTNIVVEGFSASEEQRAREAFLRRRAIPLETAARRAIDELPGNPARIVVGMDYRMMDAAARISARLAGWLAGAVARRRRF